MPQIPPTKPLAYSTVERLLRHWKRRRLTIKHPFTLSQSADGRPVSVFSGTVLDPKGRLPIVLPRLFREPVLRGSLDAVLCLGAMSQSQRQENSRDDVQPHGISFLKSSPSGQSPSSAGPNNDLIPRDYLGQRSDAHTQRAVSSTLRKTNPSPLQSSYLPPTSTQQNDPSVMPSKTRQNPSTPSHINGNGFAGDNNVNALSNNTRIAAAKVSNPLHSADSSLISTKAPTEQTVSNRSAERPANMSHRGQLTQSPPDSPTTIPPQVNPKKQDHSHFVPRTSSIDSAISSVSSSGASHSYKGSIDASGIGQNDVASLIAAAGSPENLVVHLLKEKQHVASQNAQLWKLVDKQRTLVFGLNRDLEQALKDKDHYKRKLKELQSQTPPLSHGDASEPNLSPAVTEAPAARPSQHERKKEDSPAQAVAPDEEVVQHTPPPKAGPTLASSPIDSSLMPSPLHLLQQQSAAENKRSDASTRDSPTEKSKPRPTGPHIALQSSISKKQEDVHQNKPISETVSVAPQKASSIARDPFPPPSRPPLAVPPTLPPLQSLPEPPKGNSTDHSPIDRFDRPHQQSRRAPPAPLDLNQTRRPSQQLQPTSPDEHSDSDYDDILEVDEIPAFERGRRPTRADDDKARAVAVAKEEEARSKSKKQKSQSAPQSTDGTKPVQSPNSAVVSLPTSPRQMVPQSPPNGAAGRLEPPAGLTSVLQSSTNEATSITERLVASPPMSPGLPVSPRPGNRPVNSPQPRLPREGSGIVASPPLSPRIGGPSGLPLSPRAPKQPIPLPPNTPLSLESPSAKTAPTHLSPVNTDVPAKPSVPIIIGADIDQDSRKSPTTPRSPATPDSAHQSPQIYLGLISEEYPDLLLPPNAIPSIDVQVASSRLRPSRLSYMAVKPQDEDPVFTLSVFARSDNRELWRVEKAILALPQLDQQMRQVSGFSGKLPDRKLFSGHSPAIIDTRRAALNQYFHDLLETQLDEKAAIVICHFLSTDAIEPRDDETSLLGVSRRARPPLALGPDGRPRKEGYLTKRGKNFGGWKARYFVLQGPELKYYESPGGPHLGNIKLRNAQIGKQSQSVSPSRTEDDMENQYRHAFLILEPKRKDSSSLVRHVLCAESDKERDEWVEALLHWVDFEEEEEPQKPVSKRSEAGKSHITGFEAKMKQYGHVQQESGPDKHAPAKNDVLSGISYENTVAGDAPVHGQPFSERAKNETPSPTAATAPLNNMPTQYAPALPDSSTQISHPPKVISAPKNGAIIQDAGLWGNKSASTLAAREREHKKRSIWGFRQRSSSDLIIQTQGHNGSTSSLVQNTSPESKQPVRPVFGLPLAEAVEFCPPFGVGVNLPAVVYRCIEYLRAKDAAGEEGIFRLSGSNVVIRSLKDRFNTEGDVNLLEEDQYYDVHAVASLFKQYLRELPTTVLTRELHLDFLHVLELDEKSKKVTAFNALVHRLPVVNRALLRILSLYLIEVIEKADRNKMNVRNVGIVFSPTLNIPAPVFSMFLTDFDAIFGREPPREQIKTVEIPVGNDPLTPEDIRSPRHQMFSDIPTPAYNQSSFPTTSFPNPHAMQQKPDSHTHHAAGDTGFIPMQPSYETRSYESDVQPAPVPVRPQPHQQHHQPEYGSMNRMLAPANPVSVKAKRRESSMLFMGKGPRKSSVPRMREDQSLVDDESAFD
ncbi:MAG: hypothetical protein Q9227_006073 [Pyrenula ochraceoflavens]